MANPHAETESRIAAESSGAEAVKAEREQEECLYGEKQAYAKRLLLHYFTLAIEGPGYDKCLQSDCQSEVEGIVDVIVEAAAHKIKAEKLGAQVSMSGIT